MSGRAGREEKREGGRGEGNRGEEKEDGPELLVHNRAK